MKKTFVILFASLSLLLHAQEDDWSYNKGWQIGYQLVEHQNDFGFGLQLGTPELWRGGNLRLRHNLMFYDGFQDDGDATWFHYQQSELNVVQYAGNLGQVRLYSEFGLFAIFPHSEMSSDDISLGGQGYFGFEFFPIPKFCYFLELGGKGHAGKADLQPGAPAFNNGFSAQVGFRLRF